MALEAELPDEKAPTGGVAGKALPWRGLLLAALLTLVGALLLVFFGAVQLGIIQSSFHEERSFQLLIVGLVMFVPGFYHLRIAFYAFRGHEGFHFDDIPDFD